MTEGMTVQVLTGPDRPVVVKTATTPSARDALRREADRLRRARHPGVVELMSASDDQLEVAWVGAHTLETAKLAVPAAAAVLAALATTVADLHAMGIVHGRLDASHVVLTGDGRPVLCGMVGPEPSDVATGPADDVGALGALIDHLIGPEAEPEPIPERRWSRKTWSGYHRRSLQTLADRASHDDPARRPTARALANAIVETVPEARLQASPVTDAQPAGAGPVGHVPAPEESTIDGAVQTASDDTTAPTAPTDPTGPTGPTDPPDDPTLDEHWLDPLGIGPYVSSPATTPTPSAASWSTDTILGLRVDAAATPPNRPRPHQPAADPPRHAIDRLPRSRRRSPKGVLAGIVVVVAVLVAFRSVGAPPTEDAVPSPDHQPTAPAVPLTSESSAPGPTAVEPATTTESAGSPEEPTEPPTPDHQAETARVVQAGVTYSVGEPGDRVEIADWDCDGVDTPGVVRPSTGEVFLFERWATADEPVVNTPSLIVPEAHELVAPPAGGACVPRIRLRDGSEVPVAAGPVDGSTATSWNVTEETTR